jgi:hypothetical protein
MLRLALAAALAAAALLPVAAAAQPYGYDQPTPYPDERSSRSAGDYGRDSSVRDNDRGDQDYDRESGTSGDRGYDRDDQGEHYTGRAGAAWTDAEGRRCRWREVTRADEDGYQSYKWVTVCR